MGRNASKSVSLQITNIFLWNTSQKIRNTGMKKNYLKFM